MKKIIASKTVLASVSGLTYFCLWLPVIVLFVFSFSKDQFATKWLGFTTKWYTGMFDNPAIKNALMNSLIVASVTVVFATIAGTFTAYGLYKYKFHGKKILRMTILFPLVIPYVVTAGAMLVFFTRVLHLKLGYLSIIISHISFSFPLAVFVVLGRMQRVNWSLEEAALTLGANRFTVWRTITIPLLKPSVIASAVLIFPWSFNDFTITYFVAGLGTSTLPIYVFSQLRFGTSPVINTIGTLFILLPFTMVLFMTLTQNDKRGKI